MLHCCTSYAMIPLLVALCCFLTRSQFTASQNTSLAGCPSSCGEKIIRYPFGLRAGCAREGFELSCNLSYNPPKLFLDGNAFEVLEISLIPPQLGISTHFGKACNGGTRTFNFSPVYGTVRNSTYALSNVQNKFTVLGCDTYAYIYDSKRKKGGCISICDGLEQVVNGSCSGQGCCQFSIPKGLRGFTLEIGSISNYSEVWDFNPCSYAFLVDQDRFTFRPADITKHSVYGSNVTRVPIVLDWVAGANLTCAEARRDNRSFACISENSECYDSTGSVTGYFCNCSSGYEGNPYLHSGCQDIDECSSMSIPCKGTCVNTPGSYLCYCPAGTDGNPVYYCIGKKHKMILGISIGISCGLGVILLASSMAMINNILTRKRMKQRRQRQFQENYDILLQRQVFYGKKDISVDRIKFFTLSDMEKATNHFDRSKIIGVGGYGTVYKGLLDLEVVAIKKCNVDSRIEREQFINEVILLSQITHKNVVKLFGCCFETEVPLLVYEFISHGTLFDNLHNPREGYHLSWEDRVRIATEISSALAYMHCESYVSIFHRDIKSANILLDDWLTAKISDFGTSRSVTSEQTHASTRVMGTFGYMDPEYFQTGKLTEKSDVYSLGVILVELLTGQKSVPTIKNDGDTNFVIRFISAVKDNDFLHVVDDSIAEEANKEELEIVAKLAMASLNIRGEGRPTIKDIKLTLEDLMTKKRRKKQNPSISGDLLQMKAVLHEMSSFYSTDESATTSGSAKSGHGTGIKLSNALR